MIILSLGSNLSSTFGNRFDNLDLAASPRLPLDKKAKFLKGAGVRL